MTRPARTVAFVTNFSETLLAFREPLFDAIVARGHRVCVLAPPAAPAVSRHLQDRGIGFQRVAFDRSGLNPLRELRTVGALARALARIGADVILSASSKPAIYGSLAARGVRVPRAFSIITGLGFAFSGISWKADLVGLVVRRLYRLSLAANQAVFFQNPDNLDLFRRQRLVRPGQRAVLLNGSGVDLDHFRPAPLPCRPSFLLIARLLADKGIREYVEAARIIRKERPEARFCLVGWRDDANPSAIPAAELHSWVADGAIEYLGRLDDVRPAIANAAVYVLPSISEGTPRTVLEAMAMGRPVITTDAPGCRETVVQGVNGFLVPTRSVRELAQAMRALLDQPTMIEAMGRQSRKIVESRYDMHAVNRKILDVMEL